MDDTTKGILLILLIIAIVAIAPILLIWSLNTLFGLTIAYNFSTWFAALVIGGAVRGTTRSSK